MYRAAVAATFFAEHSPCLEMRDGVFYGGSNFGQSCVELGLGLVQLGTPGYGVEL